MDAASPFVRLLEGMPPVLACDEGFVAELQRYVRVLSVRKGDYLLRTGEICHNAYFINKGLYINLYISEKGTETVTGFAADGYCPFLSAIGYFTLEPSEFEIKAIEDGELLAISRQHIEAMSLRYPQFAAYYQHAMLTILSSMYSMFAVRQSCKAEEFIRYLYDKRKWFISRVPDKYIAQYMGVSNSWYCKLKKRIFS